MRAESDVQPALRNGPAGACDRGLCGHGARTSMRRRGTGTGFTFDEYSPAGAARYLRWALGVFKDRQAWRRIQAGRNAAGLFVGRVGADATSRFTSARPRTGVVSARQRASSGAENNGIGKRQDVHRQQLRRGDQERRRAGGLLGRMVRTLPALAPIVERWPRSSTAARPSAR